MSLVAIQGIRGSYSEEAAVRMFGPGVRLLECRTFDETFETILTNNADYAVVPLKNKIVGAIEPAVNALKKTGLRISDELPLEVRHVLIGTKNAEFAGTVSVRSHPEALKQCRRFLAENRLLRPVAGNDTASAVRRIIAENDPRRTAIGSPRAAEIYGGKILRENIADDSQNITTFYLVSN